MTINRSCVGEAERDTHNVWRRVVQSLLEAVEEVGILLEAVWRAQRAGETEAGRAHFQLLDGGLSPPGLPPRRKIDASACAAAALSETISVEPATRSGSGDPCRPPAHRSGIPSAATKSAPANEVADLRVVAPLSKHIEVCGTDPSSACFGNAAKHVVDRFLLRYRRKSQAP